MDDSLLLTEDDIPGASLNGKSPSQLTVVQLKRWLACGAPISGKNQIFLKGDKCMHHLATCSCTKRKMCRKVLEGEVL